MQLLIRLGCGSNEGPQHWKRIAGSSTMNVQVSWIEARTEYWNGRGTKRINAGRLCTLNSLAV